MNQTTEYGWTPLLVATQNRYYKLGVVPARPRRRSRTSPTRAAGRPLYLATDNRNIEGGDYPVRKPRHGPPRVSSSCCSTRGADVNARMHSSTETRTIFTHQWLFEDGATPFLRAAQSSDIALMKLLLEHGADPKIDTDDSVTPLMVAAGIGWVEGVTYEWSREAERSKR